MNIIPPKPPLTAEEVAFSKAHKTAYESHFSIIKQDTVTITAMAPSLKRYAWAKLGGRFEYYRADLNHAKTVGDPVLVVTVRPDEFPDREIPLPATLTLSDGTTADTRGEWVMVRYMPYVPGDLNGDGKVTISDAVLASRMLTGSIPMTDSQKVIADVTGDGQFTIGDVIKLMNRLIGK